MFDNDSVSDPTAASGPSGSSEPSAELLFATDVSQLDDSSVLEFLHVVSRMQSRLEATRLRAIERLSITTGRDEWTQDLLAGELKLSMYRAGEDLHIAHALTTRLPQTLAALESGRLNQARVTQIVKATSVLPDDQSRQVEDELFPLVLKKNPAQINNFVRRRVAAIDPRMANKRAAQAKADRMVTVDHGEDGMSWLNASLPSEDVTAIYDLVDSMAREVKRGSSTSAKARTDTRTMDQLRADVLRDIILGKLSSRVQAHIYVTVNASTIAGLDEQPAELRGTGVISADTARRLASNQNATWKLAETDATGHLCQLAEARYTPGPRLTEFIQLRDQTCRFPACAKPAQKCDREHLIPYQRGGHTCERNCHCFCRRHHRLKQSSRWKVERGNHGELIWTTPQKRRLTSKIEPLMPVLAMSGPVEPPPF